MRFDGGGIYGTSTYDAVAPPPAQTIRNLQPNAAWVLLAWDMTVTLNGEMRTRFSSEIPGHTGELCQGICIFSANQFTNIRFTVPVSNFRLEINFSLMDPTPLETPPAGRAEFGPQAQATYRDDGGVLVFAASGGGVLTEETPMPNGSSFRQAGQVEF